jgi:hypothetical protein
MHEKTRCTKAANDLFGPFPIVCPCLGFLPKNYQGTSTVVTVALFQGAQFVMGLDLPTVFANWYPPVLVSGERGAPS